MRAFKTTCGAVAVAMAAMVGCETGGPTTVQTLTPEISLSTNQQRILTGESTTIFAETANLLGRDVEINWTTTLGQVQPSPSGARALFSSNQPGTAVITAEMVVDGRIYRETTTVTVDAVDMNGHGDSGMRQQDAGPGQVQQGTQQNRQQPAQQQQQQQYQQPQQQQSQQPFGQQQQAQPMGQQQQIQQTLEQGMTQAGVSQQQAQQQSQRLAQRIQQQNLSQTQLEQEIEQALTQAGLSQEQAESQAEQLAQRVQQQQQNQTGR